MPTPLLEAPDRPGGAPDRLGTARRLIAPVCHAGGFIVEAAGTSQATPHFASAQFTVFANDGAGALSRLSLDLRAPAAASCTVLHDRDRDGDLDITGVDELEDVLILFENRPTPNSNLNLNLNLN